MAATADFVRSPSHRSEPSPRRAFLGSAIQSVLPSIIYAVAAVFIMWSYLAHPSVVHIKRNEGDEYMFEWALSVTAHAVIHLHNPLFSSTVNAPMGVNMMGNNAILPLSILFTPITLLLGAQVSFGWILTANLVATAAAWRWFFGRHLPAETVTGYRRNLLISLGGLVCGFGPGMISHTLSHPNLTSQWLIPPIIDRVLRLRSGEHTVRDGILLGLMITIQAFLAEELLFTTFLTLGILLLCYAAQRPRDAWALIKASLSGFGIGLGVAAVLLAYPLWFQFFGPQSFREIPDSPLTHAANLKSYVLFPAQSIFGDPVLTRKFSPNYTEQESFFGWPLLVLTALIALWHSRKDLLIRTSAICAVILVILSWGPVPTFGKSVLHFNGLWYYIEGLPGFTDALPVRIALAAFPFVVLIVLRSLQLSSRNHVAVQGVVCAVTAAALVPLIPTQVAVSNRAHIPQFVTSGAWAQCAGSGTVVTVPLPTNSDRDAVPWVTETGGAMRIPQAPLFVPGPNGVATVGPAPRPTSILLARVDNDGRDPAVTAKNRTEATADFAYWDAGCVAILPSAKNVDTDRQFLTALLGPGQLIGGVWAWKLPTTS